MKRKLPKWLNQAKYIRPQATPLILVFFLLFGIFNGYSQLLVSDLYNSLKTSGSQTSIQSKKSNHTISIKDRTKNKDGELFTGKIDKCKNSIAYFQFSKGEVSGKIIIPEKNEAFVYSSKNGIVNIAPQDAHEALCLDYEGYKAPASIASVQAPPPGSTVYTLQSLAGANAVVMLDFDGHNTAGSWWGSINAMPADVNEAQITDAWRVVSEDFRPFQLNITTNEAVYQAAPANQRMRVIFTPTTDAAPGSGGVAFIGVFTTGGDLAPCWVYNLGDGKVMGETASHEIGHTMGLLHDGRNFPDGTTETYYGGQGSWAPIMGVSYYREVSHWSRGEYQYANNTEDDVLKIGNNNGFAFRLDNQQDVPGQSVPSLVITNGVVSSASNKDLINRQGDGDVYQFSTTGGTVSLTIAPSPFFPNLNVLAKLYNQQGNVITTADGIGMGPAILNQIVSAGTYYLEIRGTGEGDAFTNGYSNYSSIGEYTITGTIGDIVNPPNCNTYIQQLSNGSIKFSATFATPQAYVEVFATKNGAQHLATNITGSQLLNPDGTFTYSYLMPGAYYLTGDNIKVRFYSYTAGGPGTFTPGPTESTWSENFVYNQSGCVVTLPPDPCTDMIQQLSNGYMKFSVNFPTAQAYVEVFSTKNGQQIIAANITASQINNSDGTYSYYYIAPASLYTSGDVIYARFYSYTLGGPGVFTPGPTSNHWSSAFIYNQSVCQSCNDVYESNETRSSAKSVPVNTDILAQINRYNDHDWFVINTTSSSPNLQITLNNLLVDFDIQLFDANGNLLGGSYWGGNMNETINYPSSVGGTYYIHIYGYNGSVSTQCYRMKAKTSGVPFLRLASIQDDAQSKQTLVLSQSSNAVGLYPNPSKVNTELNIVLTIPETNFRIVTIKDLSGRTISEKEISFEQGAATLSLMGIQPGVYLLDAGDEQKQKLVIE